MNVYDTITADQLEGGEQILVIRQIKRAQVRIPLENVKILAEEHGHYIVQGYNHNTGGSDIYHLFADEEVELWSL